MILQLLLYNLNFVNQTCVWRNHKTLFTFNQNAVKLLGNKISVTHYRSTSNSLSISSILGKLGFKLSGRDCVNWYSETPIGLCISLRAYSATSLSFFLHSRIPIVGWSPSFLNCISTALI